MKSSHCTRKVLLVRAATLLSVLLFVARWASVGQATQNELISMSVCDVAMAPEEYNHKTIMISGILSATMHANTVEDPHCNFSVLIEGGKATHVSNHDRENIEKFAHMLPELRARRYDANDSSRYRVTVTGRFETILRVRKGSLIPIGHGFGDRGLFPNRLILQRVDELPKVGQ